MNSIPRYGKRSLRITYAYGTSSTPKTVERLTILMAIRDIITSKMTGSQFTSIDNVTVEGIAITKNVNQSVQFMQNHINAEIESLWEKVGFFTSVVV